jgi:polyisoprenoid-binding protein YceI
MALHDISSAPKIHWAVDPGATTVDFTVGESRIHTVRGRFRGVSGSVLTFGDALADAVVQVAIDPASIDTRVKLRDRHLRAGEYLAVKRFPTITFASTRVEELGNARLRVFGQLTIRGITREIALDATIEQRDAESAQIIAQTVLDRWEFRIGPRAMRLVVGNDVPVRITLALRVTS